LNSHHEFIKVI